MPVYPSLRALFVLTLSALSVGCVTVVGVWEGECEFDVTDYSYNVEVELTIDSARGGILDGEIEATYGPCNEDFNIEGTQDGRDVTIIGDFTYANAYPAELKIEGYISGNLMEGDCEAEYSAEGYQYEYKGDLDLHLRN